jgi:hypothetical protein
MSIVCFSLKTGMGNYIHNDGVSIYCSMFSWLDLIHPGKPELLACTYDHQPIYHYIVKALGPFVSYKLGFFQVLNSLFCTISVFLLFRIYSTSLDFLSAFTCSIFFFSSFSVLFSIQELRMYCLFILSSTILFTNSLAPEKSLKQNISLVIGYFNFYFYIIPLFSFLISHLKDIKRFSKSMKFSLGLIFIGLLIKTPFVIWWRASSRGGKFEYDLIYLKNEFLLRVFDGTATFSVVSFILTAIGIILLIQSNTTKIRHFIFTQFAIVVSILLVFMFVLKSEEIVWRYFVFLYPIFSYFLFLAYSKIDKPYLRHLLSIILLALAGQNFYKMDIRGEELGKKNLETILILKKILETHTVVFVDHLYFYQAYVGIFQQIMSHHSPHIIDYHTEPKENPKFYISVLQDLETHKTNCLKFFPNCEILWQQDNLIGQKTIISQNSL